MELTRVARKVVYVSTPEDTLQRTRAAWHDGASAELWPFIPREVLLSEWRESECRVSGPVQGERSNLYTVTRERG